MAASKRGTDKSAKSTASETCPTFLPSGLKGVRITRVHLPAGRTCIHMHMRGCTAPTCHQPLPAHLPPATPNMPLASRLRQVSLHTKGQIDMIATHNRLREWRRDPRGSSDTEHVEASNMLTRSDMVTTSEVDLVTRSVFSSIEALHKADMREHRMLNRRAGPIV